MEPSTYGQDNACHGVILEVDPKYAKCFARPNSTDDGMSPYLRLRGKPAEHITGFSAGGVQYYSIDAPTSSAASA